jgi:hypothetical protein
MDFFIVEPEEAVAAHNWHGEFATAKGTLLPRPYDQFFGFIQEGYVWAAYDQGDYAGLAYCIPTLDDDGPLKWEFGGLMVSDAEKGKQVGSTLAKLVLINTLVKEDPFRRGEQVIAHVLASNDQPRNLIEKSLGFEKEGRHEYPSEALPGLPVNSNGKVEGDLFIFPRTALAALADWCDSNPTELRDGRPLKIRFGAGFGFPLYAAALRAMYQGGVA